MSPTRIPAAALALSLVAAVGCGLGPGKDQGDVSLTVTRDYGGKVLLQKTIRFTSPTRPFGSWIGAPT